MTSRTHRCRVRTDHGCCHQCVERMSSRMLALTDFRQHPGDGSRPDQAESRSPDRPAINTDLQSFGTFGQFNTDLPYTSSGLLVLKHGTMHCIPTYAQSTILGSRLWIFALLASPSNTISLISLPVPGPFWIPCE